MKNQSCVIITMLLSVLYTAQSRTIYSYPSDGICEFSYNLYAKNDVTIDNCVKCKQTGPDRHNEYTLRCDSCKSGYKVASNGQCTKKTPLWMILMAVAIAGCFLVGGLMLYRRRRQRNSPPPRSIHVVQQPTIVQQPAIHVVQPTPVVCVAP